MFLAKLPKLIGYILKSFKSFEKSKSKQLEMSNFLMEKTGNNLASEIHFERENFHIFKILKSF